VTGPGGLVFDWHLARLVRRELLGRRLAGPGADARTAFGAEAARLRQRRAAVLAASGRHAPAPASARDPARAAPRRRVGATARATSALLWRVLRRTLRHERVPLGDERAVGVAAVDDDLAAELELIGHAAAIDDPDARMVLDVGDAEAQAVAGVPRTLHRADDT